MVSSLRCCPIPIEYPIDSSAVTCPRLLTSSAYLSRSSGRRRARRHYLRVTRMRHAPPYSCYQPPHCCVQSHSGCCPPLHLVQVTLPPRVANRTNNAAPIHQALQDGTIDRRNKRLQTSNKRLQTSKLKPIHRPWPPLRDSAARMQPQVNGEGFPILHFLSESGRYPPSRHKAGKQYYNVVSSHNGRCSLHIRGVSDRESTRGKTVGDQRAWN